MSQQEVMAMNQHIQKTNQRYTYKMRTRQIYITNDTQKSGSDPMQAFLK